MKNTFTVEIEEKYNLFINGKFEKPEKVTIKPLIQQMVKF